MLVGFTLPILRECGAPVQNVHFGSKAGAQGAAQRQPGARAVYLRRPRGPSITRNGRRNDLHAEPATQDGESLNRRTLFRVPLKPAIPAGHGAQTLSGTGRLHRHSAATQQIMKKNRARMLADFIRMEALIRIILNPAPPPAPDWSLGHAAARCDPASGSLN